MFLSIFGKIEFKNLESFNMKFTFVAEIKFKIKMDDGPANRLIIFLI
jgi:hypothetical protein